MHCTRDCFSVTAMGVKQARRSEFVKVQADTVCASVLPRRTSAAEGRDQISLMSDIPSLDNASLSRRTVSDKVCLWWHVPVCHSVC